ncbi:MAG TPA: hypothetical protein VEQ37_18270 [Actinomycetota bacterium]|nr:hypothetical protein [Actinomycetota bacterium]
MTAIPLVPDQNVWPQLIFALVSCSGLPRGLPGGRKPSKDTG